MSYKRKRSNKLNAIDTIAIIFAGGKSSRMGEDKSLLPFGGFETMSAFQYNKLSKIFPKVYISAKVDKFDFDAPLLLDNYPQSSPLVGIVSIFEQIEANEVFILSVDAPFVDEGVISKLFEQKGNYDALIAQSPSGTQPLCGIYRRSILPKAKEFLANDNHKLNFLLQGVKTLFVAFNEDEKFMNLNHPHEYQQATLKQLKVF
ncbi:MAG: molybdenum cofactor guanylyltransferase MobA [Campylobacterales bacterium]|nr:molybdenum cofactor guanylyltransferase MobA [Campylobacterales bacterium]